MITVKLYGLLRIESGIRERKLKVNSVKDALNALAAEGVSKKNLNGCVVLVNGKNAGNRTKLKDGDTVVLMSPVAGG